MTGRWLPSPMDRGGTSSSSSSPVGSMSPPGTPWPGRGPGAASSWTCAAWSPGRSSGVACWVSPSIRTTPPTAGSTSGTPARARRGANGDTVLAEYRRSSALRADPSSHRWLLVLDQPGTFHFGGWMEFGPDGYLYLSTGDGGMSGVTKPQDVRTRFGKLLRIDPLDPVGTARYSIPDRQPVRRQDRGRRGLGVRPAQPVARAASTRRPARCGWPTSAMGATRRSNRSSGPNAGKGVNYGWSICEGRHEYDPTRPRPPPAPRPG